MHDTEPRKRLTYYHPHKVELWVGRIASARKPLFGDLGVGTLVSN